jgi:L-2-hydroxyglutarate oxidase
MIFDYCVIGGGIVGLSTAYALLRREPGASIILIEKESRVGAHQTGHNSGVIHAGIYYAPGSLKATLCAEGLRATKQFCAEYDIPVETCGKLIVSTDDVEHKRLEDLLHRASANKAKVSYVPAGLLREMEPAISGNGALHSPETAIVDYRLVAETLARLLQREGVEIRLGETVDRICEQATHVEVGNPGQSWQCRRLVVCAGLQADRLARIARLDVDFRIIPFRGEYFQLPKDKSQIVSHLIYPAPDPSVPFLGVHLTRMIDGSVTVGPNAVLGLAREGYAKLSFNPTDVLSFVSFGGFWKMMWANRGHAWHEAMSSISRQRYLEQCQKYCPSLILDDLKPYRAGIRAQLVTAEGTALHDFHFIQTERSLHVCNAPSPAATSALPIGKMIAQRLSEKA